MRKMALVILLLFSPLFLVNITEVAAEKQYRVRTGDCLSAIASGFNISWQELWEANPEIKNPDIIYPDQVLIIPENKESEIRVVEAVREEKVEEAGFGDDLDNILTSSKSEKKSYIDRISSLINLLRVSDEVKEGFLYEIQRDSSVPHPIRPGDQFEQMITNSRERFENVRVESEVEAEFYFVEFGDKVNCLAIDESREELYFWTTATSAPVPVKAKAKNFKNGWQDLRNYELFGKAGGRKSRVNKITYWGVKARAVPINAYQKGNKSINVGGHAEILRMRGKTKGSDYEVKQWTLGPSGKIRAPTWESTLDVGFGKMETEYEKKPDYEGRQKEKVLRIYSHTKFDGREKAGKKFFPQAELGIGYTHPFGVEQDHSWRGTPLPSKPYNNKRLDLDYTQWLVKHQEGDVTVYPGVNIGGGKIWGHDTNYGKLGVAVKAQYKNQDIVSANVGWQEEFNNNDDGVYWNVALHFKGVYKFFKSLFIREASSEDLQSSSAPAQFKDSIESQSGDSNIIGYVGKKDIWGEEATS